ncbi:MAG: ATP-binding protein [Phycisphaerales bacterium]|nr:ATP-binding protein [Phycisphaerales bacterium]
MANTQQATEGRDPPGAQVFAVGHERAETESVCERVLEAMTTGGYHEAARFALRLAWEEAISNAIHHGNHNRPDGRIEVAFHVDPQRVYLRITDEGEGFDPQAVIDPTLDENLECTSGRGLLLMRAYMTRVEYEPPGSTVRLVLENP